MHLPRTKAPEARTLSAVYSRPCPDENSCFLRRELVTCELSCSHSPTSLCSLRHLISIPSIPHSSQFYSFIIIGRSGNIRIYLVHLHVLYIYVETPKMRFSRCCLKREVECEIIFTVEGSFYCSLSCINSQRIFL